MKQVTSQVLSAKTGNGLSSFVAKDLTSLLIWFIYSFRHAALRSITRQKPGIKEPVKDQEEQLNMLSKSLYGSRVFGGGNLTVRISHALLYKNALFTKVWCMMIFKVGSVMSYFVVS